MPTNPDLAALSEAATKAIWDVLVLEDAGADLNSILGARHSSAAWHNRFIVALVNAYRSGDLVLIDREGMRERVKAALLKEEETNWNVTLGLDEDVSDLADAAIAAILGEG